MRDVAIVGAGIEITTARDLEADRFAARAQAQANLLPLAVTRGLTSGAGYHWGRVKG